MSYMKKFYVIIFVLSIFTATAQENQYENTTAKFNKDDMHSLVDVGVGIGLYYGGFIGPAVQLVPLDHLGVFGSVGYFLSDFGWQLGVNGYIMPKVPTKSFRVYGTAMYGTNASIYIDGSTQYNKVYLGPSFGAGIEMRFGNFKKNGLNIQILYPVRDSQYDTDLDIVKNDPFVTIDSEPLPINLSIGYHFEIR